MDPKPDPLKIPAGNDTFTFYPDDDGVVITVDVGQAAKQKTRKGKRGAFGALIVYHKGKPWRVQVNVYPAIRG